MPDFVYKAKKGPGENVQGMISAASMQEAIRLVEASGYTPIEISPAPIGSVLKETKLKPMAPLAATPPPPERLSGAVPIYTVCVFTKQMAGFLKSHVPLLSALELIAEQTTEPRFKALLSTMAADIRNGGTFSETLQRHASRSFDTRYISMVKAGESAGTLDRILDKLSDHLETEEETRGQVRAALAYPLFVVLVGIGTIFFLLTFCIPRLSALFKNSYASLPWPTKILMALDQPFWQIALWSTAAILTGAAVYLYTRAKKDRRIRDVFISRLPFLGKIRLKADIAHFCSTLAMLMESGVAVYQSIEITRPVLANELLSEDLGRAQDRILNGERFAVILKESKYFPSFVTQMVAAGEESGRLSESLEEVARFYSRESLRDIKMVTSLIEPAFILLLSLVVGFIVAAMMLPIFDMKWMQ